MRSYTIFAIKDGGKEELVTTVHNAEEGKTAHSMLKTQNYFDEMVVRDVLGNKQFHYNLKTGEKVC